MPASDQEIVTRILSGDQEAYRVLVERYQNRMYAVAVSRTGDFAAAEEIVQSAFIEAYIRLKKLRDPERFQSWLWGITANLSNNWLKKRHRIKDNYPSERTTASYESQLDNIPDTETPESLFEQQEVRRLVLEAVERLDTKYREAIVLHYMEGMTYAEMARSLNLPESTMLGRLQTARKQLKEDMMKTVEGVLAREKTPRRMTDKIMSLLPTTSMVHPIPLITSITGKPFWIFSLAAVLLIAGSFLVYAFGVFQLPETGLAPQTIDLSDLSPAPNISVPPDWDRSGAIRPRQVFGPDSTITPKGEDTDQQDQQAQQTEPRIHTAEYTLKDSGKVRIEIMDNLGEVVALIEERDKSSGTHEFKFDYSRLPRGQYTVISRQDGNPRFMALSMFDIIHQGAESQPRQPGPKTVTYIHYAMQDQNHQKVISLTDSLIQTDGYIVQHAQLISNALPSYGAVADSIQLFAVIDSLITLHPRSSVYHHIAMSLSAHNRNLTTALYWAKKACLHVTDKLVNPASYRVQYFTTLGNIYTSMRQYEQAESSYFAALDYYDMVPEEQRTRRMGTHIIKDATVAWLYADLGLLYNIEAKYQKAYDAYHQALKIYPTDEAIKQKYAEAFVQLYGR